MAPTWRHSSFISCSFGKPETSPSRLAMVTFFISVLGRSFSAASTQTKLAAKERRDRKESNKSRPSRLYSLCSLRSLRQKFRLGNRPVSPSCASPLLRPAFRGFFRPCIFPGNEKGDKLSACRLGWRTSPLRGTSSGLSDQAWRRRLAAKASPTRPARAANDEGSGIAEVTET